MRWFKYGFFLSLLLIGIYATSMLFVPENKDFTFEKEINYPIEKVFPQFSSLQSYTRWNAYFADNPNLSFDFFSPYEGQGSAMSFADKKDSDVFGDMFIRYQNPNRTLRYQLFEGKDSMPYLIDLKFKSETGKTKITWVIHTPKQPLLKRSLNLISEDNFAQELDKSMQNLNLLLSNKIDRDRERESIKFDTIIIENQPGNLLLGVNVSSRNDKNSLFKNIVLNHNKVMNYVKMDLGKRDDEYGTPILITDADNYKDKEVSYFYGVALPKRLAVSDNNFSFKTINQSKVYVMYFKGAYAARSRAIQQLLLKAKKDTMRSGDIYQSFLAEPTDENQTILKLSLPVYR